MAIREWKKADRHQKTMDPWPPPKQVRVQTDPIQQRDEKTGGTTTRKLRTEGVGHLT